MAAYVIPLSSVLEDYQQRVELDGSTYVLRFRLNRRMRAWFMDLMDSEESPIAMGRRCVVDTILAPHPFRDQRPPGALMLWDSTRAQRDPETAEDFGSRVQLLYFDAAEVAAL